MGTLSKKLFKKTSSVPHDKAVKIGVEVYKKRRENDINRARFDMIVIFLTYMYNDYRFGAKRLTDMMHGLIDLLSGLNDYDENDPIVEMQGILMNEVGFDVMKAYNDYVSTRKGNRSEA